MQEEYKRIHRAFPGAVILSVATPEQLEELGERQQSRRGVSGGPPLRPQAERRLLDSWGDFLAPHFADGNAVHFTGTYSDEYGYSHGLMLVRNVMSDFVAFRRTLTRHELPSTPGCVGVEYHPSGRKILHLHALLGGSWDADARQYLESLWRRDRGWARATEVKDRTDCIAYAAKHLLKQGDTDAFDFWSGGRFVSRHERRVASGCES